ncbi:MAG: glycosyltransferase [Blastocatellia bacterium]
MNAQKPKVMFYCQHVLGMGHLIRSLAVVGGLTDFEVCFINGGEWLSGVVPPAHVEIVNLPPIISDAEFRELQTSDQTLSLDEIKAQRRQMLQSTFAGVQPQALVIEMFPFGRRKFADELLPLLAQARASGSNTKIACSLRDILVSKRDQLRFESAACRIANEFFDLVMIHSDPHFQRLEETFSLAGELRCPVVYTGFVAPESQPPASDVLTAENNERLIVVSIGGGRVGSELIRCAIDASKLISNRLPHRLLIFTGPYLPEAEFEQLRAQAMNLPFVTLQRFTPDLTAILRQADLSLSMAGYNTCLNLIVSGTRAIVYPFTGNNNQEQRIRAEKLRALGLVEIISQDELRPDRLAELMLQSLDRPRPDNDSLQLNLNGVAGAAAALKRLVNGGAFVSGEIVQ